MRQKDSGSMDMTRGFLPVQVLLFSVPVMLSGILQLIFNAADTIVVGRFAGKEALAAVGSVSSLNNMFISIFIGLSIGANVLVAMQTGAGDSKGVSESVHTSVLLSLLGGAGMGIIGILLALPLLRMMGSPEDVIDLACLYLRIIFAGLPAQMLYNFCSAILRAVGDTKRPLVYLSIAGVINVFLNLFFVIVFRMSVAGVALATIISQSVSAVLVLRRLMESKDAVHVDLKKLRIYPSRLLTIIRIGLPAGLQSSLFSFSNVVIQSSVNSFGSVVIAGNSAAANISNFVYQAMNAFQQASTSFCGQNTGARKPNRVMNAVNCCLVWATLFGIVLGPLTVVFGRTLLRLFTVDEGVIDAGMVRLWYMCGPYFLCGVMDVMTGSLRGIGYSTFPMVITLLGACAFRLLWIATVFQWRHTQGTLFMSYPVSWIITLLVLMIAFAILWKKELKSYTAEELKQK